VCVCVNKDGGKVTLPCVLPPLAGRVSSRMRSRGESVAALVEKRSTQQNLKGSGNSLPILKNSNPARISDLASRCNIILDSDDSSTLANISVVKAKEVAHQFLNKAATSLANAGKTESLGIEEVERGGQAIERPESPLGSENLTERSGIMSSGPSLASPLKSGKRGTREGVNKHGVQ